MFAKRLPNKPEVVAPILVLKVFWQTKKTFLLGVVCPLRNKSEHHCVKSVMSLVLAVFDFLRENFEIGSVGVKQSVQAVLSANASSKTTGYDNDALFMVFVVSIRPAKAEIDDRLRKLGNPSSFGERGVTLNEFWCVLTGE